MLADLVQVDPAARRLVEGSVIGGGVDAPQHVPGLGRLATAQEIASFALTLASPEHPYLTGAQLVIDGGKTAHA
ncbi:SDR family oxidoreductase [Nocardia sp. NPDC051787]|uniref:SDR family oxidoreductase n=1 Tax=Nocardia sp. NPDC051787 TaxID=3155415 RepID=UPI00343B66C4